MNDTVIRKIVDQILTEKLSSGQFSNFKVPNHTHNGVDAPRVNQANIVPGTTITGDITFAQNTLYRLGLNFTPTTIWFYGSATQKNYIYTVTAANATVGTTYTNNAQNFVVLKTIAGTTTLTTVGTGDPTASGTLTRATNSYVFTVTSATVLAGATYTNNAQTFTVSTNVAGDTTLYATGTGAPTASGTLTKVTGTGDATITFSSRTNPSGDATITFSAFTHPIVVRAHCIGSAHLGPTFYYQPGTTTSVTVIGSPVQSFVASSSAFLIDSNNADPVTGASVTVRATSDEGHLVDVEYPGPVARISLVSFYGDYLLLNVALSTGWQFDGNIVVN